MSTPFRRRFPTHPAGTILGYRKDGRPIYPIAGGSSEGGDGSGSSGQPAGSGEPSGSASGGSGDPSGQPSGEPAGQPSGQAGEPSGQPSGQPASGPNVADLQQQLEEANNRHQQMLDNMAKALGLKADDSKDPAALASRVTELEATNREQAIELAVLKRAAKHGADGQRLVDSRSFVSKLGKLNPASDGFQNRIDEAIKQAVQDDASFKATPTPARGSTEFTGGPTPTSAADKAAPGLDRLRAAYATQ